MSISYPLNHLGSVWYHSEISDVPYSLSKFLGWDFFCYFSHQDGSSKMFDHEMIYLSFTFVLILGFILSFILSLTFFLILGLILGFVFGLALLLIFGFTLFFILSVVLGLTLFFINSVILGLTLLLILSFVFGFTLFLVLCGTLLLKYDKKKLPLPNHGFKH